MAKVVKDKDINKALRIYFPIGFYLGLFIVAGLVLLIVGLALKNLGLIIAGAVAVPVFGGMGVVFIRSLLGVKEKARFFKAFKYEKIRSVGVLARRFGVSEERAKDALIYLMSNDYITGYAFNGDFTELVSVRADEKKITVTCHSCGNDVVEGQEFCPFCGTPVIWGSKREKVRGKKG